MESILLTIARKPARLGILVLMALAGRAPAAQPAQPTTAPPPAPPSAPAAAPAPLSPQAAQRVREQTADWLTRVAMVDLRVNPMVRERDYEVTALLLSRALALRPGDPTITRLALDAAMQAGDDELVIAMTRELVKQDPADTWAQLSLISARVARAQTIDARLELLEQFLGPKGSALDPAVRSRLALDAALLLREQGRADRFAAKLAQATALDPTNKDAAALAYTFYTQRVQDDAGAMELLVNLLKADPLDAQTHLAIGRLLAQNGAHKGARRFFKLGADLRQFGGRDTEVRVLAERVLCTWMIDGAERVIKDLTAQVAAPRAEIEGLIADAKARGAPTDQYPDPKSYRLTPDSEQIRLLAATSIDAHESAAESMEELLATVQQYREWASGAGRRPEAITLESAKSEAVLWARESLWLRLWTGLHPDGLEADMASVEQEGSTDPVTLARLKAMTAFRTGKVDEAVAALTPGAGEDPLSAIALGVIAESRADKDGALARYRTVAVRLSGTVAGNWCAARCAFLTGQPAPRPENAAKMEAMAEGVPAIIDQMVTSPSSFMSLFVDAPDRTIAFNDRAMLRLRLVNRGPLPLALGAERPLNTRLLVSTEVSVGGVRSFVESVPEVVNLDRRLRLMPREEITATVWVDPGFAGWALGHRTADHIVRRFRVLQGFVLDARGFPKRGPNCLEAETSMPQTRSGLTRRSDDELVTQVRSGRGDAFVESLHLARIRLCTVGKKDGLDASAAGRLADAILERYRAEDADGRLLILVTIPTGLQVAPLADTDRGLREMAETDPLVLLTRLVTRAIDASDPGFAAAKTLNDPAVVRAAALVEARLKEDGVRGFSKMTGFDSPGTGPLDP